MASTELASDADHEKINLESRQIELALRLGVEAETRQDEYVFDVTYQGQDGLVLREDDASSYAASHDGGMSSAGVSYDPQSTVEGDELPCSLETCLALNRAYQQLIQDNLLKIEFMLSKNQQKQADIRFLLSGGKEKRLKPEARRRTYWCVKSHYFRGNRTEDFPPLNEDVTAKMKEHEPILWRNKERRFSAAEKRTLKEAVKNDGLKRLLTPLMNRKEIVIQKLRRSANGEEALTREVEGIEKEILKIKLLPESGLFGALDFSGEVDWMQISTVTFDGMRTPTELRGNWENLVHPSINSKPWNRYDDQLLKDLVQKHGRYGKWDVIAEQMEPRRSVYQCFTRYQHEHNAEIYGGKWTQEQELLLEEVVDMVRCNELVPWALVSTFLNGKHSHEDCRKHYYKTMHPPKSGRWKAEEDKRLLLLVKVFGDKANWWRIAHYMSDGRSYYQCRDRYELQLRHGKKTEKPWTYEEDKAIFQIMYSPDFTGHWRNYLKSFPNRTGKEVYYRSVRVDAWAKYCNSLVGSHNALSLSAITEPGKGTELKDEWIRALLPPGVPMDLAKAMFRPELEGTAEELERDLRLMQADQMKGLFIPHIPSNINNLSKLNYACKQRDFVTGMLQTAAQKAEAEKFGQQPASKSNKALAVDNTVLEKYLTSEKGANVSEEIKEKLRSALKNAEKISMKYVFKLCAEMRKEILHIQKRKVNAGEHFEDKLASIVQSRLNSRKKGETRLGMKEDGFSQHLRVTRVGRGIPFEPLEGVDSQETLMRMVNLLSQALEIDVADLVAQHSGSEPPADRRIQNILDVLNNIQNNPNIQQRQYNTHDVYTDQGPSSHDPEPNERVLPNIWRGDTFPSTACPPPLTPNNHTLFAFRNILLDRRKLFKAASKFIHGEKTKQLWFDRVFAQDEEYQRLLSRFVTLFMWPALLSAMPVSASQVEKRVIKRKNSFPLAAKKRRFKKPRKGDKAEDGVENEEDEQDENEGDIEMEGDEECDEEVMCSEGEVVTETVTNGHVSDYDEDEDDDDEME